MRILLCRFAPDCPSRADPRLAFALGHFIASNRGSLRFSRNNMTPRLRLAKTKSRAPSRVHGLSPNKPNLSGAPVAQQLARRRAGAFTFREGLFAVDYNRAITLGVLHPPPFTARKIVYDFADPVGLDAQSGKLIHHHVGPRPFAQHSA